MMTDAFREHLTGKIGALDVSKIERARVGIAGAGGLGSNCAAHLVRSGFWKLTIADFDAVDVSNLDRQFYFLDQAGMSKVEALKVNLLRIRPGLELTMIRAKIEQANIREVFGGCDVVVECFDRADNKSMLVSELLQLSIPVVSASGVGGFGSSDDIRVHRMLKGLVVIGDLNSDIAAAPALSPRVSIAAAKQADVVLEIVLNR
jgi:sulfur carrier protein ThiS adenylyltransferase